MNTSLASKTDLTVMVNNFWLRTRAEQMAQTDHIAALMMMQ